jgi:Tol biopolymer transport system component
VHPPHLTHYALRCLRDRVALHRSYENGTAAWPWREFLVAMLASAPLANAQVTERVSVGSGGAQGNLSADLPFPGTFVSGDGRFIAFRSAATNLVVGDTNGTWDVFVRDRLAATTERVSVSTTGMQGDFPSGLYGICLSEDGRYVVFESLADNLVPGDTNGFRDLFLRDRLLGTTECISIGASAVQANASSFYPAISADGRLVAFESPASNLVVGDTNAAWDVFLRDRQVGTTTRASVGIGGTQANGNSGGIASISSDGRYIAFASDATNLVAVDVNASTDAFVYDGATSMTELVSVDSSGLQADSWSTEVAICGDGRFVAFTSDATNLVTVDGNASLDVFVHDRLHGGTERLSVASNGAEGNGNSKEPKLSSDGRYASFTSGASNLVTGDTNYYDIFVHDRVVGSTERISTTPTGAQANGHSEMGSISADGRYVLFRSDAPDVVGGDTNGATDCFLRDRQPNGFLSMCSPGAGSVIACPCGNPPAGLDRGCDNSSGTGGASITASGVAYLSIDSLVFNTSGEKPNATSILLEGNALLPTGLVFGQGVRCVGGALKRLYVKTALGGGITAPDLPAGDPTVSARMTQLGAPLLPGQPSMFLVFYRDPSVPSGCAPTSTFNCTQTGSVIYWP